MCTGGGAVQSPKLASPVEPLKNAEADADQAAARTKQRAAAQASLDSTFTARAGGSASVASGKTQPLAEHNNYESRRFQKLSEQAQKQPDGTA